MDSLTRAQKIELLKDYQAGKPVTFPEAIDATFWQFDGLQYIRVQPKTDLPHPSNAQLYLQGFLDFVRTSKHKYHVVWDSTFTPGDIELKDTIVRIGVIKSLA